MTIKKTLRRHWTRNMKVLVDTNILMDALTEREPFAEKSKEVLHIVSEHKAEGYLA